MNKGIRNILIVAFWAVGGGWIGLWLNQVTGNNLPPLQSLGALVWLVTPAGAGLLLRAFGGDGWQDAGFRLNLRPGRDNYLFAIFIYPLITLLLFGVALATKAISLNNFNIGAYLTAVSLTIAGSLVKNIFEELAWRGYLTPRLAAAKIPPLLNHLVVGLLWWAWHLPYYHYFLDRDLLNRYLSTSLTAFLGISLFASLTTAILFGELRLRSQSIWPVFILHNLINGFSMPLLLNGFITLNGRPGTFLSPTNDGPLMALLLGFVGLGLYYTRTNKSQ